MTITTKEILDYITHPMTRKLHPQRARKSVLDKKGMWQPILDSIPESSVEYTDLEILRIFFNGNTLPVCSYCGKHLRIGKGSYEFGEYCSKSCAACDRDYASVNEKREQTNIEKYGVPYQSQRPEVKSVVSKKASKRQISTEIRDQIGDKSWLHEEYVVKGKSSTEIAKSLGCDYSTVLERCRLFGFEISPYTNVSWGERSLADFIEAISEGLEIKRNVRDLIPPYEVDIYIPELNLAIEYCGLYWHSDKFRDSKYHVNKTSAASKIGVELLTIFETEWKKTPEKLMCFLFGKLGKKPKIGARNTEVREISRPEAQEFEDLYHIQGHHPAEVYYGLYRNGNLLSTMSFGKPRFDRDHEYEIIRYCVGIVHVPGGASKLFKKFVKDHSPLSIITYSDLRFGGGGVYKALGFNWSHWSQPSYWYFNHTMELQNRMKFQKHKLVDMFDDYDPELTERENMNNNGYRRIWDCGNSVWKWQA